MHLPPPTLWDRLSRAAERKVGAHLPSVLAATDIVGPTQPEVSDLDNALPCKDKNVGRLQVAVDAPFGFGVREPLKYLMGEGLGEDDGHAPSCSQDLPEIAIQVLQH